MPALLSPRGSSRPKGESESEPKKSKGVMGRIKSTFMLGRRKSASSTPGEASAIDGKELAARSPEESAPSKDTAQDNDDEADNGDNDDEADIAVKQQPSEYKHDAETEIRHFSAEDDADESASSSVPTEVEAKHARVATFELPTEPRRQQHSGGRAEDKDVDNEDEEVFASDYKQGSGPRDDESKDEGDVDPKDAGRGGEEDEDEVEVFADDSSNQDAAPAVARSLAPEKSRAAPHESDLMVIGLSPAKYSAAHGPSASPMKRSQPPVARRGSEEKATTGIDDDNQQQSGPSRSDTDESVSDRIASAHSMRPSRQPTAPSSPAPRAQLLSDFQFGTDGIAAGASPVPSSPMKRRGAPPSLQPRRSFQRDQEQQLSVQASGTSPAASPKRKPDTPSAVPSARSSRAERRQSLQGITEEVKSSEADAVLRPSSPRRVSREPTGRRRSMDMEAPILASSFGASAPEVHEEASGADRKEAIDGDATAPLNDDDENEIDVETAFAFDAGAAITQELGENVARLLGADPWGNRQDAFDAILYQLKKTDLASAKNKRELLCAAIAAIQCGVEDRVAPVMYCALDCLRSVLKEYAPVLDRSFLKYQPMNEQLSALTKAIVGKLGDSNKRTQREAAQAIVRLAKLRKLKAMPHVLLHLSAKEVAPRLRVDTLRQLVNDVGVDSKTGMNIEVVMQFALPALKIAEEKTRKAAVELIAELHMINGQAVNAQLVGIKPEMLRIINRRVDELLAKKEEERQQQAAQNANQAEEEGEEETVMELVAVPSEDSKVVNALIETQLHQAQNVIGPVNWRKLESKTWSDRKEALVDMEKTITEAKSDLRDVKPAFGSVVQHNFLAYVTVVHRSLADSIAPVVNSAMDSFSTLIKVYGPCVEWREESVRDMILLTIMRLFSTMQKPNNRTNRAACRCILKLTRLTNAHTLRYALSCVFAKETDALVQMHLLRLLVPEFGFQSEGISPSQVLGVVATALAHTNEKVRKTAIDVATCTQRLVGKDFVLKHLKDVKPVTLKELEKNFVDGVQTTDGERPQTVHASAVPSSATGPGAAALPPVQFGGSGSEQSRRLLNSAPVGIGKLHCTPPHEDEREANGYSGSFRRASVLSNDEESLMDSILGNDDF